MANLNDLLNENSYYINQFKNNELMRLIQSDHMSQSGARANMLDSIQVLSDYFQKTVMLRSALCEDRKFLGVAYEHLKEEFGHNVALANDRKGREKKWDPILESCSSWFAYKMFTLDQEEKTALVHLVLESSANLFFQAAHRVMKAHGETDYFQVHSELDEGHEEMGKILLEGLSPLKYERLLEVQAQGWGVMNALCERIANLTLAK